MRRHPVTPQNESTPARARARALNFVHIHEDTIDHEVLQQA
jgi:hypothetical protein